MRTYFTRYGRCRVNVQLIDAKTDTHRWADRLDRPAGDLFALQNGITSQIAVALHAELISAEAARRLSGLMHSTTFWYDPAARSFQKRRA